MLKRIKPSLSFSTWNFSLYCVAFAAFLFLLAQLTMTSYAQSYFQEILGWGTIDANKPLSYFWTAQCVGLFISPIITRFIPLKYILLTFILIGLAVLSCILYIPDMSTVFKAAIIFGIIQLLYLCRSTSLWNFPNGKCPANTNYNHSFIWYNRHCSFYYNRSFYKPILWTY